MKQCAILLIVCIGMTVCFAQDAGDAAIVASILEKCGLTTLSVDEAATIEEGNVITLNLKNRDIAQDGISFIPKEIGQLTQIRELNCSGNNIDSIPSELGACTLLTKVDLSSNRIDAIPPAIGELKMLTHLDLRHNSITTIAPEIKQCKNLFLLQLTGNKLEQLPEEVVAIAALKELYLKDNRLRTLPKLITKKRFRYIDFIGNRLCNIEPSLEVWIKKVDRRYRTYQKCW